MTTTTHTMTRKQAEQAGYTVDTHCSPWLGYKGPRFAPTERITVLTDLEAELLEALKDMLERYGQGIENVNRTTKAALAAIAKAEGR